MHYLAVAVDYDGTIAHNGRVDPPTIAALERLRAGARRLILVTGRELPELQAVMPRLDVFDLVVAENGALLFDPASGEEELLADPPPAEFVARLRAADISPLSVGRAIVATWEPNEDVVLHAIHELGLDLQITFNKGAVMVLPGGVTKASGLRAALERLELSPLNCVGVGDAENDLAFLELCGQVVAVANALPSVKARASVVTNAARGAGVAELVERLVVGDLADVDAARYRWQVALAQDEAGREVPFVPHRESLLLTGQSGGGKSTLVLGLLERLTARHFQWCVLDPEGDYEDTEGAVSEGDADVPPNAMHVLNLLRRTGRGVVSSMLAMRIADRSAFLARLLPEILALREQIGRPHVVVVDEAHHMLSRDWDPGGATVPADLEGFLFVTTTPDQVARRVLDCVGRLLVVGPHARPSVAAFCRARGIPIPVTIPELKPGEVLMFDPAEGVVRRLRSIPGIGDRRRHRLKYAQGHLGEDTSFYFHGREGKLNLRAHNLILFLDMGDGVDEETWEFHRRRGDYSAWIRDKVKDSALANEVAAVEASDAAVKRARAQVRNAVQRRYTAPG